MTYTTPLRLHVFLIFAAVILICFSCISVQGGDIEAFIIAHSHIDPGWLRTIEEYRSEVHAILGNVVRELQKGAHRKFIWAETIYFKGWYESQTKDIQKLVRHYVQSGRLEFVGGGWVQNDEACPSYTSIIEQMSTGHEYLLERFGVKPKIAWQIDPFGHDSRVPQLFAQMGFDALVINRVHHKIKQMMKNSKSLEFMWNVDGFGNHSIFTNVLHTHYSAPVGFDFENPGVQHITTGNIHSRASQLVQHLQQRSNHYKTNHLLIPFGDDFKFKNAETQYRNMDQLIDYINNKLSGVKIRYATLSDYFESLFQNHKRESFPELRHDFFPYADNEDSYWSGYFTSLPNLKKRTRDAEAALAAAETAYAFGKLYEGSAQNRAVSRVNWLSLFNSLQLSREDVGVVQHHDAITGTCRTHVYHDYMSRLSTAIQNSKNVERQMINVLLSKPEKHVGINDIKDITDDPMTDASKKYSIIVHNPTSHKRSQLLRFKSTFGTVDIIGPNKKKIPYQSMKLTELKDLKNQNQYEIFFAVDDIEGFSIKKYTITLKQENPPEDSNSNYYLYNHGPSEIFAQNSQYKVLFNPHTGYITSIEEVKSRRVHNFKDQFLTYITQRSGSYIFRPNGAPAPIQNVLNGIFIARGPLVDQVTVRTKQITFTVRLFHIASMSKYIEFFHEVNPIPGDNEFVTRIPINSGNTPGKFLTFDGLNFIQRKISSKAPLAGRFYPSPAGAIYRFDTSQLVVITQHTMAVTATNNELEFMFHRRLNRDDGRGMSQANNDDSAFSFSLYISYETKDMDKWTEVHRMSHSVNFPMTSYLTSEGDSLKSEFTPLSNQIDQNLQVITLKSRDYAGDDLILRMHNINPTRAVKLGGIHMFSSNLFVVDQIREVSLNVVHKIPYGSNVHRLRKQFKTGDPIKFSFTEDVAKVAGDAQNSQEEGVFLSDAALTNDNSPNERKLMQTNLKPTLFGPNALRTFVISLKLKSEMNAMHLKQKGSVILLHKQSTIDDDENDQDINQVEDFLQKNDDETEDQVVDDIEKSKQLGGDNNYKKYEQNINNNHKDDDDESKADERDYQKDLMDLLKKNQKDNDDISSNGDRTLHIEDHHTGTAKNKYQDIHENIPATDPRTPDMAHDDYSLWNNFSFVLIVSMVGIACLFFYFFIRRRKSKAAAATGVDIPAPTLPLTLPTDYSTNKDV